MEGDLLGRTSFGLELAPLNYFFETSLYLEQKLVSSDLRLFSVLLDLLFSLEVGDLDETESVSFVDLKILKGHLDCFLRLLRLLLFH